MRTVAKTIVRLSMLASACAALGGCEGVAQAPEIQRPAVKLDDRKKFGNELMPKPDAKGDLPPVTIRK